MQDDKLQVSKLVNKNENINKLFSQAYAIDYLTFDLMELDL